MSQLPFINHGRFRWPHLVLFLFLLLTMLLPLAWTRAQMGYHTYLPVIASAPLLPPAPSGPLYGVNFISAPERPATAVQYEMGLATGATWNRWPLYWFNVERSAGLFCWQPQTPGCAGALDTDSVVLSDLARGLRINAILLGTPAFYTTAQLEADGSTPTAVSPPTPGRLSLQSIQAATPVGLYDPIFSDGSDVPGPGKQINPTNRWARFVYTAVSRYKPGGVLAQQYNWPTGVGITHWEMWNEPDLPIFWNSSLEDFARLQKVGYLAAKQADPGAQILFGALANNHLLPNYYRDVLLLYDADPLAAPYNYFHDILATHSYFHAWKSWLHVWRAERNLVSRGLAKPIWLNESGVPAWNDYPGPVWDPNSSLRATMEEQASYIIQSALYALAGGADAIFHFQLFDGCGNQPAYTNFPPHNGELCTPEGMLVTDPSKPCAGDANGLYRNPNNDANFTCFTQHLQAGTARPALAAFQVLTTYIQQVTPPTRQRQGVPTCVMDGTDILQPPIEVMYFQQPANGRRIVAMWTLCHSAETAVITALNPQGTALLVAADGSSQTISAQNGVYLIPLPAATNRNPFPGDDGPPPFYPIGGRPYLLIEQLTPTN